MIVVPAINCLDFECAEAKLSIAKNQLSDVLWVHIDVVDGKFAPNITWGNPVELLTLKSYILNLNIEVHLMVVNPEKVIDAWLKIGMAKARWARPYRVKRIIVHLEVMKNAEEIVSKCKAAGVEAMLAINPDTPSDKLTPYFGQFKSFQILGVKPGLAGQGFQMSVLDKIKFLRERVSDATLEVDGGITPQIARTAKEAGANIIVSASYIFDSADPRKAYEELAEI